MIKHFIIFLFGDVQGVFMRRTVKREAERLGLQGIVQNEADGSVKIQVEGQEDVIQKFISWLEDGADEGAHKVLRVEVDEGKFEGFQEFEIK